jgi:hypothetical protein
LEIKQRVQRHHPGFEVIVVSTHTHHGPDTIGFWGPDLLTSGVDPAIVAMIKERAVKAILEAISSLRPAWLRTASGHVAGVAKNARTPFIVDDELTCLQFIEPNAEASAIATLLIFPCHPEVLWETNPEITSDYPAYLRGVIENATQAPCLFCAGALGGMMTPDVATHTFPAAEKMGIILGQNALSILEAAGVTQEASLSFIHHEYRLPLTNPLFQSALSIGLISDILDEQREVLTETNLLKIGPAWLISVPGELLPSLGLKIKAWLRQAGGEVCAIIGLANDELGYILPDEEFIYPDDPLNPGDHYEETMSIGGMTGTRLLAAVCELLDNQ